MPPALHRLGVRPPLAPPRRRAALLRATLAGGLALASCASGPPLASNADFARALELETTIDDQGHVAMDEARSCGDRQRAREEVCGAAAELCTLAESRARDDDLGARCVAARARCAGLSHAQASAAATAEPSPPPDCPTSAP